MLVLMYYTKSRGYSSFCKWKGTTDSRHSRDIDTALKDKLSKRNSQGRETDNSVFSMLISELI